MSKHGNKFTCWSCDTKFYDLNRPNPVCPKCGADPRAPAQAAEKKSATVTEEFDDEDFDEADVDVGEEE